MSLASMLFRRNCKRNDDIRDAGLKTPEDIIRFDDIRYGPDRRWNVLDVYRPKGAEGKLPVIVSVHGGGWVYGDKERYQYYCMSLAQQGFAVVNYTYRLAPEFKFPAALEDTDRVFRWVLRHAEQYGYDPGSVFAVGDSAGAHLLALYCCLCADPDLAADVSVQPPAGFSPAAVALNCGIYRPEKTRGISAQLMSDLLPGKGTEQELRQLSVVDHLTKGFPPSFVMTAEGDFLADAALPFAVKLRSFGVPAEFHYYGDKDHVLGHVFHCNMNLEEAHRCNREECKFFRRIRNRA